MQVAGNKVTSRTLGVVTGLRGQPGSGPAAIAERMASSLEVVGETAP